MTAPLTLAKQLAVEALTSAETEPAAIQGLIAGAAIILTSRFGSEAASQMILDMVIEARLALATAGMVAEPTRPAS